MKPKSTLKYVCKSCGALYSCKCKCCGEPTAKVKE